MVREIIEGCRRARPSVDNRAPITISILREICNVLPVITHNEFDFFKAIFTSAYFGLFRISELVVTRTANAAIKYDI